MKKVFVEPAALIDIFNGPSIRAGVEMPVSYAFSVMGVGGIYSNGYYVRAGIKRYGKTAATQHAFIGLSAFVKSNTTSVSDNRRYFDSGSYEPKSGTSMSYDVEKFVYGGHAEIGMASRWRHWIFEWYAGAGVRVKTITPSISDDEQGGLYHYHESMIDHFSNTRATNSVAPSLILGIRTGYAFGPYGKRRK